MSDGSQTDQAKRRRRLGVILTVIFVIALIMGPGPGITIGFINAPSQFGGCLPFMFGDCCGTSSKSRSSSWLISLFGRRTTNRMSNIFAALPPTLKISIPVFAQADLAADANELGNVPFYVLGGYLVLLLVLGIFGWLKSKGGEEDYYLAGREQGWLVSSLTIMATFFSSFALLGAPGLVYKEGVTLALFSLNVPVAGLSVYLLGSRIWKIGRRMGYVTPGDMIADYYGSRVSLRLLVALTGFLYAIPYVVMQIQAGGLLSKQLFGEDYFEAGAILLAAITTLYIMVGGMRSVAWTDLIQGILLISGMLVCGFSMFLLFDGPANFSRAVVQELPASSLTIPGNSGGWPWTMLFTVCLLGSVGSMVQPAQWMRYYSANSVKTLQRGALVFALVLTTCFILGVMLIGMAGQVFYPLQFSSTVELQNAPNQLDSPIPEDLQEHFHFEAVADEQGGNQKGKLVWSWSGTDRPITADESKRLSSLSKNAEFRQAVKKLQTAVADRDPRPSVLPNPLVDPDPTDRQDFDSILVVVLNKKLPDVLGTFGAVFASLIIVAIMAASMSTADSNLHALSAVLTRDVYDQYVRPSAKETERVWVGRAIIVVATIVSVAAVILGRDPEIASKYEFMNMIAKMGLMAIAFSSQVLPITIDVLFLNKGTGKGAAAGLAAGVFVAFLFGPLYEMLVVDLLNSPAGLVAILEEVKSLKSLKMHGSVWGLAVNVPVFIIVSLFTKKPNAEKVQTYRDTFAA